MKEVKDNMVYTKNDMVKGHHALYSVNRKECLKASTGGRGIWGYYLDQLREKVTNVIVIQI